MADHEATDAVAAVAQTLGALSVSEEAPVNQQELDTTTNPDAAGDSVPILPTSTTGESAAGLNVDPRVDSTNSAAHPSSSTSVPSQDKKPSVAELAAPFIFPSSAGAPFVALSRSAKFVRGVPGVPLDVYHVIADAVLASWGVGGQSAISVLADFEGEAPGFGGELTVGQFLLTSSVRPNDYSVNSAAKPTVTHGLLVNMREKEGAQLVKRLMTNPDIAKIMWGTDGDIISLRYQHNLGVMPCNVVDVQLQHSDPGRRLGMARALDQLRFSSKRLAGLPAKEGNLDFTPRIRNQRILPFPLSRDEARYSVDDLHRIEALVCDFGYGQKTVRSGKLKADRFMAGLRGPDSAVSRLEAEMSFFYRKRGPDKLIKAVELLRAVIHIESVFLASISSSQSKRLNQARETLARALRGDPRAVVPVDLGFAN
eukprot:INCI12533.1.p1 GENE.INCI12533.1~~INCI12533.1.p1  ORF type:complete len:426 (-),score=67.39 INCI12533.1:882-2159(-)